MAEECRAAGGVPLSYMDDSDENVDDDDEDFEESFNSDDDDDDLDDDLMSREFIDQEDHSYLDEGGEEDFARGVDLDDLHTYHDQHFNVE